MLSRALTGAGAPGRRACPGKGDVSGNELKLNSGAGVNVSAWWNGAGVSSSISSAGRVLVDEVEVVPFGMAIERLNPNDEANALREDPTVEDAIERHSVTERRDKIETTHISM